MVLSVESFSTMDRSTACDFPTSLCGSRITYTQIGIVLVWVVCLYLFQCDGTFGTSDVAYRR